MSNLVTRALELATRAHKGQLRRYTNEDYITHPIAVMHIVKTATDEDEDLAAALMHDVEEDTDVTNEEISSKLGVGVGSLVKEVTNVSKKTDGNRKTRKAIDKSHLAKASDRAKTLKIADGLDNIPSIMENDQKFGKTYLLEKMELLPILKGGNKFLWKQLHHLIFTHLESIDSSLVEGVRRRKTMKTYTNQSNGKLAILIRQRHEITGDMIRFSLAYHLLSDSSKAVSELKQKGANTLKVMTKLVVAQHGYIELIEQESMDSLVETAEQAQRALDKASSLIKKHTPELSNLEAKAFTIQMDYPIYSDMIHYALAERFSYLTIDKVLGEIKTQSDVINAVKHFIDDKGYVSISTQDGDSLGDTASEVDAYLSNAKSLAQRILPELYTTPSKK